MWYLAEFVLVDAKLITLKCKDFDLNRKMFADLQIINTKHLRKIRHNYRAELLHISWGN